MATQEQIHHIMALVQQAGPAQTLHCMDHTQAGIGAVMAVLSAASAPMTAGQIAQATQVSTARTAVLLKKMEQKGLILREKDPRDGRITRISLSPLGREQVNRIHSRLQQLTGHLIDRVGMEKLQTFLAIAGELRDCLSCAPDCTALTE